MEIVHVLANTRKQNTITEQSYLERKQVNSPIKKSNQRANDVYAKCWFICTNTRKIELTQ